ncbi:sulfotransferase family 2 domain-containing protein [Aestuariivirga sp.]|uniref:sulfotransferase family 2 domain-containing protein n=1 Tax=Aestuariivirga sp. TaxID=2650926 RepID=UPI0039E395F5
MLRNYVFLHIPKTGGTSLRTAIVQSFEKKGYLVIYDYVNHEISTPWLRSAATSGDAGALVRNNVEHAKEMLLIGHFPASKFISSFHPASFFTFLREPFAQIYSNYNHHVSHHGYTKTFEEFIATPLFQNIQWRLCNKLDISEIGFVGLLEQVEDDLPRLVEFLGIPLELKHRNVGNYALNSDLVREKYEAMVQKFNPLDFELYEHAKAVVADKRKRAEEKIGGGVVNATRV